MIAATPPRDVGAEISRHDAFHCGETALGRDGATNMNTRFAEIWAYEDAAALRRRFSELGLDPDGLLGEDPDPRRYERRLRALLLWVDARRRLGSREAMLRHRWLFPPVHSRGDGDEDWARFETWFRGGQLSSAEKRTGSGP